MPDQSIRTDRFRNTSFVIDKTRVFFDEAYEKGLMGRYVRSVEGRDVVGKGHVLTDFVRCSYLGLDNHPRIVEGAIAAVRDYGSLHWSCARTRLNFAALGDLEARLGDLFRARVIAFSTVMLANLGAIPLWASGQLTGGRKPLMAFDRMAHASLAYHKPVAAEETGVVTIGHNDMAALEELCREHAPVVYVADGVYSMGGAAPIAELRRLQERYDLYLYIDDAHGISIFGDHGEGYARSQMPDELGDRVIIAASLGKGFGASGGILMMGTAEQEALFRRYAQPYVFSVGPNLAAVGASLASAEMHADGTVNHLQLALADRIACFDALVDTRQRNSRLPIRMIAIGDEREAIRRAADILEQGFYTSVTFFPTVARGAAGIRICLTASHTHQEIERLAGIVNAQASRKEDLQCIG